MSGYTIVLVLRSGGDFTFRDVELIARHINGKWEGSVKPRIICLWDNASEHFDLGNIELIPLTNDYRGTWARMALYSPEMEQYRPFLYVDLDTAVIKSIENIFELVRHPSMFITLEDFYQRGQLATGLVWVPANSKKVQAIWDDWSTEGNGVSGARMDYYLRKVVVPDAYWQQMTDTIHDFKPKDRKVLTQIPENADLVCFHGKPRIYQAAESSMSIGWVKEYVDYQFRSVKRPKATVIISYKEDRGWLQQAIDSVPADCQLILAQGDNGFSADFNAVLPQVQADYVRYLHDDDMLTPNCIDDSVRAIEEQDVDLIHGNVVELGMNSGRNLLYVPPVKQPTLETMLKKNTIHSASVMYRKSVFDRVGGFDPDLASSEDYEFNLRCLHNGMKIGYCQSTLAFYRRHPKQKVRNTSYNEQKQIRALIRSRYVS